MTWNICTLQLINWLCVDLYFPVLLFYFIFIHLFIYLFCFVLFFVSPELSSVIVSPELSSVRDYVITHSMYVCMYVVFWKIDHCIHIHWCIVMGLGHNDPWVDSHMWPQQTWGQRSSRGQWPLVQVFGKKGQCILILWCIFKSNITMIAKVCDRESRRDTWFENRLVFTKITVKPLNFAGDLILLILQVIKICKIKYPWMFKFYIYSNRKTLRFPKLSTGTCKDGSNFQSAKLKCFTVLSLRTQIFCFVNVKICFFLLCKFLFFSKFSNFSQETLVFRSPLTVSI